MFEEFVAAAGIGVIASSVRCEEPPLPDISCVVDGRTWYFELTQVADQGLADEVGRGLAASRRTGNAPIGKIVSYSDRMAIEDAVEKKAAKPHVTNESCFGLLLYCDGLFHPRVEVSLVRRALEDLAQKYR